MSVTRYSTSYNPFLRLPAEMLAKVYAYVDLNEISKFTTLSKETSRISINNISRLYLGTIKEYIGKIKTNNIDLCILYNSITPLNESFRGLKELQHRIRAIENKCINVMSFEDLAELNVNLIPKQFKKLRKVVEICKKIHENMNNNAHIGTTIQRNQLKELVEAGATDLAVNVAMQIPAGSERNVTLRILAERIAAYGEYDLAINVAENIPCITMSSIALSTISRMIASSSPEYMTAIFAVIKIRNLGVQYSTLKNMVESLYRKEKTEKTLLILSTILDEEKRSFAFAEIVSLLLDDKNYDLAIEVAKNITDSNFRETSLVKTCIRLGEKENFERAKSVLLKFLPKSQHLHILRLIGTSNNSRGN